MFYRANILALREYSEHIKTPEAHRKLLAWDGVHTVDQDQPMVDLRQICNASQAAARQDVINKLGQEQRQQRAKGKRKSTSEGGSPAAKAKGSEPPSTVRPTEASSSSSWGWRSRDWSEGSSQRSGLELESELGAMALVEPSLNTCEHISIAFA